MEIDGERYWVQSVDEGSRAVDFKRHSDKKVVRMPRKVVLKMMRNLKIIIVRDNSPDHPK